MAATVATKVMAGVITSSPGPMPSGKQREMQRGGAGVQRHGFLGTGVGGEATSRRHRPSAPENIGAARQGLEHRGVEFRLDAGILRAKIEKRNHEAILLGEMSMGWPRWRSDSMAASSVSTTGRPRLPGSERLPSVGHAVDEMLHLSEQRLLHRELRRPHVAATVGDARWRTARGPRRESHAAVIDLDLLAGLEVVQTIILRLPPTSVWRTFTGASQLTLRWATVPEG